MSHGYQVKLKAEMFLVILATNPANVAEKEQRIVIDSHWESPLPYASGWDRLWEETSATAATSQEPQAKNSPELEKHTENTNSPQNSKTFIAKI